MLTCLVHKHMQFDSHLICHSHQFLTSLLTHPYQTRVKSKTETGLHVVIFGDFHSLSPELSHTDCGFLSKTQNSKAERDLWRLTVLMALATYNRHSSLAMLKAKRPTPDTYLWLRISDMV
ncbi:hypothetical protein Ancab_015641 [Ancistrocladus abbreviatus]